MTGRVVSAPAKERQDARETTTRVSEARIAHYIDGGRPGPVALCGTPLKGIIRNDLELCVVCEDLYRGVFA